MTHLDSDLTARGSETRLRLLDGERLVTICENWIRRRVYRARKRDALGRIARMLSHYRLAVNDTDRLVWAENLADLIGEMVRDGDLPSRIGSSRALKAFYRHGRSVAACDCCTKRSGTFTFSLNKVCAHCLKDIEGG